MIIKNIAINILNLCNKFWQGRKVGSIGKNTTIYYTGRIHLTQGAMPQNISLNNESRVYGTIVSCGTGKVSMGAYAALGANSYIKCSNSISIGEFTAIAPNVIIQDNNTHPVHPEDRIKMMSTPSGHKSRSWLFSDSKPIEIGVNCWIGENSRICKGVKIGDGSIIAANSVVTHDVPGNSIAAGNPAKIVKQDIDKMDKRYFDIWPLDS